MKTRCPCCGTTLSLDALIAHDDAREALSAVFKLALGDEFSKSLLRYLGLFRPADKELTMQRVSKLLNEILPDIQAQRITRNRQVFEAPKEAWLFAFNQAINARDAGKLITPLKTHGWLYEVISQYKPTHQQIITTETQQLTNKTTSKTVSAIETLQQRIKRNQE